NGYPSAEHAPHDPGAPTIAMGMRAIHVPDAGLDFASADGPVKVTFCSSRIVRVTFGAGQAPGASFVAPRTWTPPPVQVADQDPVRLATSDLRLEVETSPLRLTFADAGGAWLLREPADGGMAIERDVAGAARVRARFTFSDEQHFYGLGHGGGRLDRLGQGRVLWNSHLGHGPGSDIAV